MWVKVCGITRATDAVAAADAGVSAIGLNFCSGSKRFVSTETARQIVDELRQQRPLHALSIVGVFVNTSAEHVASIAEHVALDVVQFHGDESPELLAEFFRLRPAVGILRALRCREEDIPALQQSIRECRRAIPVFAWLLDAFVTGQYGGTGARVPEGVVQQVREATRGERLVIAGGLTPLNVNATVRQFAPWGVDTAGGVEDAPGIKNADQMREFVSAAAG